MTIKSGAMLFAVTITVAGCGSWSPFSGPAEQSRIPRDAAVYQCEGGKTLAVRVEENGKSVMVIFPEREFRLDQTDSARYSNGRTTLHLEGNDTWLEESQTRVYSGCKKKGE